MADQVEPRPPLAGRPLADRLRARIEAEGPITFAAFMEAALYDPDAGFYSRLAAGGRGHFETSPRTSPAFAMLLGAQLEELWERLDRPDPFWVVEVGAGDGTLAAQLLELLPAPIRTRARYVAVERSPAGREAMAGLDARVVASIDDAPSGVEGVVLANELLDNVAFHRVRRTPAGPAELYVGVEGAGFALVEGPPSSAEVAALTPDLRVGEEAVVRPDATALLGRLTGLLARGYVWIADYGFAAGGGPASPHGYRSQREESDVLADPGSRDITAAVDFDALSRHAGALGHRVWGPVTQRQAMLALGFREMDGTARRRQVEAASAGRGLESARIHAARSRAGLLLDPAGLGGFLVLCIGVGEGSDAGPPAGMTGAEGPEGL
jgi:SAM-dependent MidA family methyltransferase